MRTELTVVITLQNKHVSSHYAVRLKRTPGYMSIKLGAKNMRRWFHGSGRDHGLKVRPPESPPGPGAYLLKELGQTYPTLGLIFIFCKMKIIVPTANELIYVKCSDQSLSQRNNSTPSSSSSAYKVAGKIKEIYTKMVTAATFRLGGGWTCCLTSSFYFSVVPKLSTVEHTLFTWWILFKSSVSNSQHWKKI